MVLSIIAWRVGWANYTRYIPPKLIVQRSSLDHLSITEALLQWYGRQRRSLPWRDTRDPYRIWVSEVMLQQTQVTTVVPYYRRFLERFPTLQALAEAELDQVLALWQGLGYYARARNLHAAARIVCRDHAGVVPASRSMLMALPGVGPYTAGAILSIAYGLDLPAIDGNVKRVLCRLFDYDGDPDDASGKRMLSHYAEALLPRGRAGDYNQAMMELGATVCVLRRPRCGDCPLAFCCRALALGVQAWRPLAKRRTAIPSREFLAALCQRGGRLLIVRRFPQGLLGGLWELPGGELFPREAHARALGRHLSDGLQVRVRVGEAVTAVKHAYTHFRVTVHVYQCSLWGEPQPSNLWDRLHWMYPSEIDEYGLTGVTTKALAQTAWPNSGLV